MDLGYIIGFTLGILICIYLEIRYKAISKAWSIRITAHKRKEIK